MKDFDALREEFIRSPHFTELMQIEDYEERKEKAKVLWRKFINR